MLEKIKQIFMRKSDKSEFSSSSLPRNRFADLDFERVLKSGARRLVNEEGRYAEDGKITELEFPEDFAEFEFLVGFNTEEEEQFQQLLARLNSIDNAIQSYWKARCSSLFPSMPRI